MNDDESKNGGKKREGCVLLSLAFAGLIASLLNLLAASGGMHGRPDFAAEANHGQSEKEVGPPPGHTKDAAGVPFGTIKIESGHHHKHGPPPPQPSPTPALNGFGAILAGITAQHKTDWGVGRTQFQTPEELSGGLGPIFNANPTNPACFACHSSPDVTGKPVVGGASALTELRTMGSDGTFNLIRLFAISPAVQDLTPINTVLIVRRVATPLFGVGFIEGIPDEEIIANAQTPQKDGVHGTAVMLTDPVTVLIANGSFFDGSKNFVGRFGWKCQQSGLLQFASDAEFHELGETNPFFPVDDAPHVNGNPVPDLAALIAAEPAGVAFNSDQDPGTDPTQPVSVTNKADRDRYRDFMEFNALPPQAPFTASALRGQAQFTKINCVACHKPNATTGQNTDEPALSLQTFSPFSDFLVHDMGSLGDGIVQVPGANPLAMRTAPLWGLRARPALLHDGRFPTSSAGIIDAILAHDGEAATIRNRFERLSPNEKQDIVNFLNSI